MRGGYIHNRVLLDPIDQKAWRFGAQVDREVSIRVGGQVLYGDLLIRSGSKRILVEAELSARRIPNDLAKAVAFRVSELWLVVPNPRLAQSVRRKLLQQSIVPGTSGLFILLLPQALQRLERIFCIEFRVEWSTGKRKRNQYRMPS